MRRVPVVCVVPILWALEVAAPRPDSRVLLHPPMVELGADPGPGKLSFMLQTPPRATPKLEVKVGGEWRATRESERVHVDLGGVAPHDVLTFDAEGLPSRARVPYRVTAEGRVQFSALAATPPAPGQGYEMAVFGDCGGATPGQAAVGYQAWLKKPSMTMIVGDVVYDRGRASEYARRFFPQYLNQDPGVRRGSPLFTECLAVSAAGNHDTGYRDMNAYPDGLAWFVYWRQPPQGPTRTGEKNAPIPAGAGGARLIRSAGSTYPRSANFGFDYGDSHWTVLDSNVYVNWKDPQMRDWLDKELARGASKAWRFVAMHHPPYHSSRKNAGQDWMLAVHDLFLKHKVDVVFCGHVHNYQRSAPMQAGGAFDRAFDGKKATKADGVVYVVQGAGGAALYDQDLAQKPAAWKPYTLNYLAGNSFGWIKVGKGRVEFSQIDGAGKEIDRWALSR
ncbi:MAG: metallophosphoesterase [Fimbriimonadaceae bacterium]|nr:metallophosphoesterase [Fimbriimonadaceae bacterium]QYK56099.1 MAG: metallophosphoesterase [Fimbriimonadaceae bacterium]